MWEGKPVPDQKDATAYGKSSEGALRCLGGGIPSVARRSDVVAAFGWETAHLHGEAHRQGQGELS
jgi:hypothetical protein